MEQPSRSVRPLTAFSWPLAGLCDSTPCAEASRRPGAGWPDAYRLLHPRARAYTWYSPNAGNGFRLDQAFVNQELLSRLREVRYVWGTTAHDERRDALSDHAAMIVELYD